MHKIIDIIPKPGDKALFVKEWVVTDNILLSSWEMVYISNRPDIGLLVIIFVPGEGEFVMYNNVPVNVC